MIKPILVIVNHTPALKIVSNEVPIPGVDGDVVGHVILVPVGAGRVDPASMDY